MANTVVDNLIALRILYLLVTPFVKSNAYKLGIIDDKGNYLKKSKDLKTTAERESFSYLHRLVFTLKRLLAKLPGGDNRLKSFVAALYLIKEFYPKKSSLYLVESRYNELLKSKVSMNTEEIEAVEFLRDIVLDEEPRIPRKEGQPAGSKKHSDLYTDENPKGTIHGLKFATEADAEESVKKIKNSDRSHAHKIQAAVAMEQRAKAMGKASAAAVYRRFINSMKKNEEVNFEEDIANVTGAGVSTDAPVVSKRAARKYQMFNVKDSIYDKFKNGKTKWTRWSDYLNLEDEGEALIYNFARKNPKGIIVLKNGDKMKAIRFNRYGGGNWSSIQRSKETQKPEQIANIVSAELN